MRSKASLIKLNDFAVLLEITSREAVGISLCAKARKNEKARSLISVITSGQINYGLF